MNHSSCRLEDRELPLDAHVPDEDPLPGLRAPHGAHVVLGRFTCWFKYDNNGRSA